MILTSYLTKLRISELLQFVSDVISICLKYDANKLQIVPRVEALKTDTDVLDTAFKISSGSSYSEKIIAYDQRRDAAINGIYKCCEGFVLHFNPEMREAAQTILDSLDKYGSSIAKLNYQSETSTISSLEKDWENNTKLANALAQLNFIDWAAELKIANTEFNELYLLRNSEKAETPQEVATDVRLTVIESYRKLVNNINAREELDETGQFRPIIAELNALIEKYNLLVTNRTSRAKAETVTSPAK